MTTGTHGCATRATPACRRNGRPWRPSRPRDRFVAERLRADGPELKPPTPRPGHRSRQNSHSTLPGYPGRRVKSGNWVKDQFQLDAFGEALLVARRRGPGRPSRHQRHWPARSRRRCDRGPLARRRRRHLGAGRRPWAHSRLTCAAGLRSMGVFASTASRQWSAFADAIVADTNGDCLHPTARWQRAAHDPRGDAALLLPAIRGALPPAIGAAWPPSTRYGPTCRPSAFCTAFGMPTSGCRTPKARSCSGIRHGSGRAPTGKPRGGCPMVRTQPSRLRSTRPVVRGVRRQDASCAAICRRLSCMPCCSNAPLR